MDVVAGTDSIPYALIDWEFAGPVDALVEVAHAAWLNAQLHDDDTAERCGLPQLRPARSSSGCCWTATASRPLIAPDSST